MVAGHGAAGSGGRRHEAGLAALAAAPAAALLGTAAVPGRHRCATTAAGRSRFDAPPRAHGQSAALADRDRLRAAASAQRLVATDRYSNWPRRGAALPKVGGLDDAQIELIVACGPTWCWLARSARAIDRLEALGLQERGGRDHDLRRRAAARSALVGAGAGHAGRGRGAVATRSTPSWTRAAAPRAAGAARRRGCISRSTAAPYAAGAASFIGETAGAARRAATSCRPRWGRSRSSTPSTWCSATPT